MVRLLTSDEYVDAFIVSERLMSTTWLRYNSSAGTSIYCPDCPSYIRDARRDQYPCLALFYTRDIMLDFGYYSWNIRLMLFENRAWNWSNVYQLSERMQFIVRRVQQYWVPNFWQQP
ncbi:hypothetical protein Xedl_02510 [Xenorhabdus eapokensis]|uniref:Uncharacterized protein n=1 Tax=Xenorhabdus eapokensis TaxID=1873482 RepID=A0A1Q5TPK2_9GAMM|nr:hypothetical protein Xedl_02510 [Xenorhabdus eapokensis]